MNPALQQERILFGTGALFFAGTTALAVYSGNYWVMAVPFAALFLYAGWLNRNLVFLLLLLSLPFSSEYHFSDSLGTDIPDEFLMLLTSFIFMAAWLYEPAAIGRKWIRHPLPGLLALLFGWMLLAVLFSSDRIISLKFILAKCWYIGAFVLAPLVVFRDRKKIAVAAVSLLLSMAAVVLITLFRQNQTGFRFATVNDALSPFFRNHVNYSAMLVCLLPIAVTVFYLNKNKTVRLLSGTLIIVFLFALFFSYSRGAWLALPAGIFAAWLIRRKRILAVYVAALLLTGAGLCWLKSGDRFLRYAPDFKTTIFHKNFSEHFIATYQLKDVSTAERFYRWIAGLRMIRDRPLTGYGPNTFYENYKGYALPAYKTWVSDNRDHSTVHNYFLLTAIEQGIPGLLWLLVLFGALLFYAQRLYHRVKDVFYQTAALVTGVIVTMIMVVNFLSDLIETDKIGSLFFLSIALLVCIDRNSSPQSTSPTTPD